MDEFRSLKIKSVPTPFLVWMAILENYWIFFLHGRKRLSFLILCNLNDARLKVKVIVTDMNVSYASLIKECFPKAKLVVDRFHIVKHLIRKFEDIRVRIMKALIETIQHKPNIIDN
ncbi:transposase [Enterococcus faecium]|uniref:transposase n=1 Tax=Enterococcus faecium TaxID=1352 RepID=UPI001CC66C4D|nr:transposase [Enterococcus faecium]